MSADLTRTGRDELLVMVATLRHELAKVQLERDAYLENLTATQTRCTELLGAWRASRFVEALGLHPSYGEIIPALVRLAGRVVTARMKHPGGADGVRALVEEVGEVASAMRRESPERVRDELLDVAAVAIRMWLGEVQR